MNTMNDQKNLGRIKTVLRFISIIFEVVDLDYHVVQAILSWPHHVAQTSTVLFGNTLQ